MRAVIRWLERVDAEHLELDMRLALEPVLSGKPLRCVYAAGLPAGGSEREADYADAFDVFEHSLI